MIHPVHHIAGAVPRYADIDRFTVLTNHHWRTGGIKADTANPGGIYVGGFDRVTNRPAHRSPDIIRRLFDYLAGGPPDPDGVAGLRQHHARCIKHPGAGAAGADINARKSGVILVSPP